MRPGKSAGANKLMLMGPLLLLSLFLASASAMASPTRRVLVTGANKGIGRAICKRLLTKFDDTHVLLGSRDIGRGEQTAAELALEVSGAEGRITVIKIDTSSDESVACAAEEVSNGGELFGIVNNAGIGFGNTFEETLNTNYFGPRRVNDAFGPQLLRPGGRVVNVASASGPMFVAGCGLPDLKMMLADPLKVNGDVEELDKIARSYFTQIDYGNDSYGLSKALLNAYTVLHAKSEPELVINSCTPGYIATDLTAGMGATNTPDQGAVCPVYVLMSPELNDIPTGRYYGSDTVRSPLDRYRGPGDPPFEGP